MTRVDLLASIKATQTEFKTLDCGCRRHSACLMFGQRCRRWASISGPILLSPAGLLTMTALSPLLNHRRHSDRQFVPLVCLSVYTCIHLILFIKLEKTAKKLNHLILLSYFFHKQLTKLMLAL